MQSSDTFHLLVSCGAQPQLEACLGLFREAGHSTRAHRVTSMRDLGDMLRDQRWDLLIADDDHPEVDPADALKLLKDRASDTPCVVRAKKPDAPEILACLELGAHDVIPAGDGARLLAAARREITALREHRELRELRTRYEEIAHRVELLLAASQDAIAYVVDGMHVHANEVYAGLFGYASVEDLASAPLVDLIAAENQQEFKAALRRYRDHPEEQTAIDFTGVRADGAEFAGRLVLSTASYEGEPCMQVLVRAAPAAPVGGAAKAGAPAPGGMDALAAALAASGGGHLLLIGVSGFASHVRNMGMVSAMRLVDLLGAWLAEVNAWPQAPLRVGDGTLAMLVQEEDADRVAAVARHCVEQVSTHIHSLGSRSATCNICVTACPITGLDATVDALIDRAFASLGNVMDRAEYLRGADPARVDLMQATIGAAPPGAGAEMGQAIDSGEFRLLFQPLVSLRGDSSEYYEVHVEHVPTRLRAPAWLESSPASGTELDHWAITEACRRLVEQRAGHPHTSLIITISAGSIADPDFVTWLAATLRSHGLPPDCLVVQMSHRDVSSRLREATEHVGRLRDMGCQISVSAVHSANNPITDMVHLKPQFARVDDALSAALKDADSTSTLLKPLIEALHQERIASVIPNVEGAGVLAVLWQLGVHFIQGNYLQPPSADMHYEFTDIA